MDRCRVQNWQEEPDKHRDRTGRRHHTGRVCGTTDGQTHESDGRALQNKDPSALSLQFRRRLRGMMDDVKSMFGGDSRQGRGEQSAGVRERLSGRRTQSE